eukprot:GFUD01003606.1.p1 GENE.GFUD01003606.1~~GFUD01003606.1.p1  ORF type:complete len:393 (+),score=117.05 GFUD01003606.1:114-1181(+)
MDTSALFRSEKIVFGENSENYHVGDLNIGDEDVDIVLTVEEMVKMYNDEDTYADIDSNAEIIDQTRAHKNKFERLELVKDSKQTQNEVAVDFRAVADAGVEKKCVEKVVLEEDTEWDQEVQCHHRYRQHCYKTYSTAFNPVQEEECQDNYKKNCFIEFGLDAVNHTVRICRRPLEKDCSVEGEEFCSTHFETECWTRQLRQEVEDDVPDCKPVIEQICSEETAGYTTSEKCSSVTRLQCRIQRKVSYKYRPVTECKLTPVEICAPAGCGVKEGPEVCHDRRTLVVYDKPEESCNLEAYKSCQFVTKLVPHLKDHDKCIDIPLEICVRYDTNPRLINKPVLKIWCYKAKAEGSLAK